MSAMTTNGTVTVIGAGLGGIALIANLGLAGYRLRLHDRDDALALAGGWTIAHQASGLSIIVP